jgi:glycosyltransferase involved in cell wall biosynthesis
LSGGGTRIKIIEAASYGKPIVATATGIEGIDMLDEKHVFIRNNPEPFADACVKLLEDKSLCEKMGNEARKVAELKYEKSNIVKQIREDIIKRLK